MEQNDSAFNDSDLNKIENAEKRNSQFSIRRQFDIKKQRTIENSEEREMLTWIMKNKIDSKDPCFHMTYYLNFYPEDSRESLFIHDKHNNSYGIKIAKQEGELQAYLEIFNCPICGKSLSD